MATVIYLRATVLVAVNKISCSVTLMAKYWAIIFVKRCSIQIQARRLSCSSGKSYT